MQIHLLKGALVGLVSHQSNPVIEEWETRLKPAWTRTARYAIGGLTLVPVGRMFFKHLYRRNMEEDEAVDTFTVSLIVALVSYGSGVAIGYMLDSLIERLK